MIVADWALHCFKGIAILLIVIHLSLSAPLITAPHPLLPSGLVLPSQNPRTAFQFSFFFFFSTVTFCIPPAPHVRRKVSLLTVLHAISDFVIRKKTFPLPSRMQGFFFQILHILSLNF